MGAATLQPGALQSKKLKDTPDQASRNGENTKEGGFVQHGVLALRPRVDCRKGNGET
jgi:hypothetical protein